MNKEEESIYLQNIDEYIFEENKIVTYQWLCKTLDIHVNIAKQLLYTYANQESKTCELSISYLLTGVPKDGLGYHFVVVKDDSLEESKKAFQTISSEHVYSVQKVNSVIDLNVLYTVDILDDHKNNNYKRLSSIDFESVERDSAVLALLRAEALPIVSKEPIAALKKTVPKPTKPGEKSPKKQLSPNKKISPKKNVSNDKGQSKENGSKQTVSSMFAKAAANKKCCSSTAAAPKTVQDTKPKPKGIVAFFNAPAKPKEIINNDKNKETVTKMEVEEQDPVVSTKQIGEKKIGSKRSAENKIEDKHDEGTKEENVTKSQMKKENSTNLQTKEEDSKKSQTKRENSKQTQSGTKKESKGKKRTKKSIDKERTVKKRKRIVVMSDSESSSDEAESDHIERDPTPPPQPTIIEDEIEDEDIINCTPVSKRHRRRLVDTNYLDSEGFMCTKKEFVTESCSDEEDSNGSKEYRTETKVKDRTEILEKVKENKDVKKDKVEDKPILKPNLKKKQTTPQKKKQTNLMSFFGKKS